MLNKSVARRYAEAFCDAQETDKLMKCKDLELCRTIDLENSSRYVSSSHSSQEKKGCS